jgi:LuxR family maltose regulon positive regulatory protein
MIIQSGRAAEYPVSEMLGFAGLTQMALEHGRLHFAFEMASQGIERIEQLRSLPSISGALYEELGQVYYQWHQLEQAHGCFLRAMQLSTLSGYSDVDISHAVDLSRLHQMEGNLQVAAEKIEKAVDLMQAEPPVWVREEVVSQQVRVYLAQNRLAAAEMVLKEYGFTFGHEVTFPAFAPEQDVTPQAGFLYNSALRVLLHRAQTRHEVEDLKHGIKLADRLISGALQSQYIPVMLEALVLRAKAHAMLGDDQSSLADYASALELAEPEGFISVFVEEGVPVAEALATLIKNDQLGAVQPGYVQNVLAAFPTDAKLASESLAPTTESGATADEMIEPLSERELEVLRLIGEGCSNQEIAERLVVTLHTVKKHSSNIYTKLGVSSRTQAIAHARRFRLL